jgi:hypothetical protein
VSQCFIPLETLAIPFPLLWNLVSVPTHSQNKKKIPSLASHARNEGESLGSVFLMEGALRERSLPKLPAQGAQRSLGRERSAPWAGSAVYKRALILNCISSHLFIFYTLFLHGLLCYIPSILDNSCVSELCSSQAPSTLLGFLVWDQAVRAMAKDPSEGPQYITRILGQGPSNKSLDVF